MDIEEAGPSSEAYLGHRTETNKLATNMNSSLRHEVSLLCFLPVLDFSSFKALYKNPWLETNEMKENHLVSIFF